MDTTWKVTEADRDEQGSIKMSKILDNPEPRSLADLLPRPSEVKQDAKRQPWTRLDAATLAVVGLCAAFVLVWAWSTPGTPPAPATARPTVLPTILATAAPTAAPTLAPTATAVPTEVPTEVPFPVVEQPVAAPVPCSADTAPYRVEKEVLAGSVPIGAAMGFSCISAAEAEANADQHELEVRSSYAATTTTKTAEAR